MSHTFADVIRLKKTFEHKELKENCSLITPFDTQFSFVRKNLMQERHSSPFKK